MRVRRIAGLAIAAAVALPLAGSAGARPQAQAPLWAQLERALAVPQVDRARSGALAVDLATGKVLFQHGAARSLVPASNEKLAVTYAALVTLGPAFRIRTDVLGLGTRRGDVWKGHLVLKGYGDPTLSSTDLRALAAQVRASGIRRITGRVVADESFFDGRRTAPGWKGYFFRNECEPLSALVVDRARRDGLITLRPARAAGARFAEALRAKGVSVHPRPLVGRAPPGTVALASTTSAPLWQLVRFMDLESDNFTAEMLVKQLGALYGRRGSTGSGVSVITRILAADGIPLAGVRIVDGSGLSRLDRLTARALIAILQSAWANPTLRRAFLAALPVAGRTGTLRHRMQRGPARGRVYAKTGTTSLSSALSGFVGNRYAFAIVQNGYPVASWWAQQAQDRFAATLAAAK